MGTIIYRIYPSETFEGVYFPTETLIIHKNDGTNPEFWNEGTKGSEQVRGYCFWLGNDY